MDQQRTYYSREAEMRAQRERAAAVLIFLAVGVVLGTLVALLFAPQSGKRTRRELAHSLEGNFGDSLEATAATVRRLEKDFADLRRKLEARLPDRR